jgi:ribosomal protein L6P/L9E
MLKIFKKISFKLIFFNNNLFFFSKTFLGKFIFCLTFFLFKKWLFFHKRKLFIVKRFINSFHSVIKVIYSNLVDIFSQEFQLLGFGYRIMGYKSLILLDLGFSHGIFMQLPKGIFFFSLKRKIFIKGILKQIFFKFINDFCNLKGPSPYKLRGLIKKNMIYALKETKKR